MKKKPTAKKPTATPKTYAAILDSLDTYSQTATMAQDAILREGVRIFCRATGLSEWQPDDVRRFYELFYSSDATEKKDIENEVALLVKFLTFEPTV
jgi:hypothetical protein